MGRRREAREPGVGLAPRRLLVLRCRRLLVEAVALRGAYESRGSHLHAEWRENRIARLGEALGERAAAELAVGVLKVDAVDHGLLRHRKLRAELGEVRLENRRGGDQLEGRARGLRG